VGSVPSVIAVGATAIPRHARATLKLDVAAATVPILKRIQAVKVRIDSILWIVALLIFEVRSLWVVLVAYQFPYRTCCRIVHWNVALPF